VEQLSETQIKSAGPARGIQFQVSAGDGRVDVRVTDRAGEVRVDVRTPDLRLAGALRADLPELAARIEQTGYHAETWPPLASLPERSRIVESGPTSQNMQEQSQREGGQRQDEGRRQNSEDSDQPVQRKHNGKDFKWLFSSIR